LQLRIHGPSLRERLFRSDRNEGVEDLLVLLDAIQARLCELHGRHALLPQQI
jgi:hypothetical protein